MNSIIKWWWNKVKGRKLSVRCWGTIIPQASTCGEIVLNSEFYAYDTKYIDDQGRKWWFLRPLPVISTIKSAMLPFRPTRRWAAAAWRALMFS